MAVAPIDEQSPHVAMEVDMSKVDTAISAFAPELVDLIMFFSNKNISH